MHEDLITTHGHLRPANTDEQLISLWLFKKSSGTQEIYLRIAMDFLRQTQKPLNHATLADLQFYIDSLQGGRATQRHKSAVLQSLFSFAVKIGYLPLNPGAALTIGRAPDHLAERILTKEEIDLIIDGEENPRNHCLLRILYCSGARISEVVGLRWGDCRPREEGGQITVLGKGQKTRTIRLSTDMWEEMMQLRGEYADYDPVFRSRHNKHLSPLQAQRIVRAATERVGIEKKVSPHWFRHAHASHSLDNGAPPNLVMETLGHASLTTTSAYVHARPNESSGMYLKK
jgi:integrase/recombinase XerD